MLKRKIILKLFLSFVFAFFTIGQIPVSAVNRPELSLDIGYFGQGPVLYGTVSKITSDMQYIEVLYSLDNNYFKPINSDHSFDLDFKDDRQNEPDGRRFPCGNMKTQVVQDYVNGKIDVFYIALKVTTDTETYIIDAVKMQRAAEQDFPDDFNVQARGDSSLLVDYQNNCEYNITVSSGMTKKDILNCLPSVLPVQVQLFDNNWGLLSSSTIDFIPEWNIPDIIIDKTIIIENPMIDIKQPHDLVIKTLTNSYKMVNPISVYMPIKLNLNMVDSSEANQLKYYARDSQLLVDFPLKPTGARQINLSYSLDGGETWESNNDILLKNDDIEKYPKNEYYTSMLLFQSNEAPYRQYLHKEINGFLMKLDIVGGVLDGKSEIVNWPVDYKYEPPIIDNEDDGSGGNRGDVGSGNGEVDDSVENGGQRPSISEPEHVENESSLIEKPPLLASPNQLTNNKITSPLGENLEEQGIVTDPSLSDQKLAEPQSNNQVDTIVKHREIPLDRSANQSLQTILFIIGLSIIIGISILFIRFKHSK
ncbi:MAG: hypothetical protein RR630_01785 [Coprobacillus sp.]